MIMSWQCFGEWTNMRLGSSELLKSLNKPTQAKETSNQLPFSDYELSEPEPTPLFQNRPAASSEWLVTLTGLAIIPAVLISVILVGPIVFLLGIIAITLLNQEHK